MSRFLTAAALLLCFSSSVWAEDKPKTDPRYPFRTDSANAHLPWYQPKAGVFPPHHSDHRVSGELVAVDFVHRTGQFRAAKSGELMDFTMPPYGAVNYLNAEADLRDVPLGTDFLFFLNLDSQGRFTCLAAMLDQYTIDAGHAFSYKLDDIKLAEGKLLTTKHSIPKNQPDLGKKELVVTGQTRVWKNGKPAGLADLAVGDELLFNLTGKTATHPGRCTEIWAGVETHQQATEQQRQKFAAFVKFRGLPGWVDRTEGNKITLTLFSGDPKSFQKTWMSDFAVGNQTPIVVANDELRTWNPPTDKEKAQLLEIQKTPLECYGSSGVRLVLSVPNMLEGFRKGRVVRVFGTGWPIKDPPYGEGLMNYGYSRLLNAELVESAPKDYPTQFPFRTDFGNEQLPWYQLKEGVKPPRFSEHLVFGEIVKTDSATLSGQFRADRGGELVTFTLLPEGSVRYLGGLAPISDLPPSTRCRFHMYQDDNGAFSRASFISDEASYLASHSVTYRIEALKLREGKFQAVKQLPKVKNYDGDMVPAPDFARAELRVDPATRVWKGQMQIPLSDLTVGDSLLVNLTGELPGRPSYCSDIWVGDDTHRMIIERLNKRPAPPKRKPMERKKP